MKQIEYNTSDRIAWIDLARGMGIIFVMLGHCYLDGRFTFYFYSFHMALFFFLSGVTFSSGGSYLLFIKKKAKTLLVPYCFLLSLSWA